MKRPKYKTSSSLRSVWADDEQTDRQTDRQTIPDRQNKNLNGLMKPTTKQEVKWLMRNEKIKQNR